MIKSIFFKELKLLYLPINSIILEKHNSQNPRQTSKGVYINDGRAWVDKNNMARSKFPCNAHQRIHLEILLWKSNNFTRKRFSLSWVLSNLSTKSLLLALPSKYWMQLLVPLHFLTKHQFLLESPPKQFWGSAKMDIH